MAIAVFYRMSRRTIGLLTTALVVFGLFVGGCGKKEKGEPGQGKLVFTPVSKDKALYALVPKSIGQIYWEACRQGMEKAGKEEGVKCLFTGPPTTDIAKQIDIIENLLLQGATGIAISPNDPTAVARVINNAIKQGVPVVTFDSDSPKSRRLAYIGTDNEGAGRVAGETLAKYMGGKGKVAVLTGGLGALNLNQRIKGFKDAVKKHPDMKIIAIEADDDDSEKATAIAENLLMANADLGGFFGVSAPGAPGAARAVKAANRVGKVRIVGFDDTPECRQYIKEGIIDATVAQRPFDMGYQAIKVLVRTREGKLPEKKIMDTGVLVITKDNLEETEQK